MKFQTLIATAILALAPTLSMATECNDAKRDQTVMSCAEGFVLDATSGTCVEQATS